MKSCPRCHAQLQESRSRCEECGYRFESAAPSAGRPDYTARQTHGDATAALRERLAAAGIWLVLIAVAIGIGWGLWAGVRQFIDSLDPGHPFPLTREEAASIFLNGLATEDYQGCYNLLDSSRRAATVIETDNRYRYFRYFQRIRDYLVQRCGPDFIQNAQPDAPSGRVQFANGIELTILYAQTRDSRKRARFGIDCIREFPIDKAPSLGLEQRNRAIEQAMADDGVVIGEIDRPEPVLARRPGESASQRLHRLLKSYPHARMLDARHAILEAILRESPAAYAPTTRLLQQIIQDPRESPVLQRLAQSRLDQ